MENWCRMKNSILKNYSQLWLNNYRFKFTFFAIVVISFYAVVDVSGKLGFFNAILNILTNQWIVALILLCFFLNTINYCAFINKKYNIIQYFKNKESFIKFNIYTTLIINAAVLIIFMFLTLSGLFIKFPGDFNIHYVINGINIILYILFLIARIELFSTIFTIFIILTYYYCNSFISYSISIMIVLSILFYENSLNVVSNFKLFFPYYLHRTNFDTFSHEFTYSLLETIILWIINLLLFFLLSKSRRDICR